MNGRPRSVGATRPRLACAARLWLAAGLFLAVLAGRSGNAQQQMWPLWEAYKSHMIDPQGRVVDHTAQDHTTSEGQSYGMFFALVANDRACFDSLLHWTEVNLAGGDLGEHLPAWLWGKDGGGTWRVLDENSAADSDLWIAYDLMEAGRLWHEPRYEDLGRLLAARIARREVSDVPGVGTILLPSSTGFHPDANTWLLNPSYLPPFVVASFARAFPAGPWGAMRDSFRRLLAEGSGAGFAMDWILAGTKVRPAVDARRRQSGAVDEPPVGSYEAIRVYLWLGIADPETEGVRALFPTVSGMATYLQQHDAPPERVDDRGRILSANSPPGFSAAVIPYLHALGLKQQERLQIGRLAAAKDASTGLYGRDGAYYDQNLALFSLGWSEHRYRFDRNGDLILKWRER